MSTARSKMTRDCIGTGRLAAALLAISVLGGCATLSEYECRTADWESIGYQDGSEGRPAERIEDHVEACRELAITPDREEYLAGRTRGLEQLFCTARTGLRIGRQGANYSGVCPPELEISFLQGFDLGRQIRDIEHHMEQIQYEVQRLQSALRREDSPLTQNDRDYMLYRLRELEREFGRWQVEREVLLSRARNL